MSPTITYRNKYVKRKFHVPSENTLFMRHLVCRGTAQAYFSGFV